MLLAITLIGVFVMSSSHLEWLMSNNSRFQTDAGMRAEAALREGEYAIEHPPTPWGSSNGLYNSATLIGTMDPRNVSNWSNLATLIAPPPISAQYIVENLSQSCLVYTPPSSYTLDTSCPLGSFTMSTYRVWALATDSKGAARIAQSTYRKIDNPNPALIIGSITIPSGTNYQRIDYAAINND